MATPQQISSNSQLEYLGGTAPETNPRTDFDIDEHRAVLTKAERSALSAMDHVKIKERAEKAINRELKMMTISNFKTKKDVKDVYSVSILLNDYYKALLTYDMQDVLTIPIDLERDARGDIWPVVGCDKKQLLK
uniref:Uncharacterized protein n=1 Tax=Odontella aurita TaxID=265563 RepID=A0A7S4JNA2_9STRA|mmetsp:Transcript_49594/g.149464  ORF Transcript_49594/g.149464 Transcript_49594/m.149464 type:complete len:134 (+) Transcript_49594:18-419(+)